MPVLPDIRSYPREPLLERFAEWGEPAYRVDQVLGWLYARPVETWEEMTNLPLALRRRLAEAFGLSSPQPVQVLGGKDTTRKFLWQLADGALIESVLIPANPALYGEASDRHTLCVSTQVGCAYGCKFCASGLDGWKRNLSPAEIVGQVLAAERWQRAQDRAVGETARPSAARFIDNLVIMGMGEPLANYEALLAALRILNAPWGGGIGARKITVSTSGLVPQIRQLAAEPYQFGLAISLHGATDEVRSRLMPVNRKYPLRELVAACEAYLREKGRQITLEYILIAGVNDGLEQASPLAALAAKLRAKVNLIPYNRVEGLPWERPSEEFQERFLARVVRAGARATLRREKGHDIDAACGQLRLRTERQRAPLDTPAPGP